MDPNTIPATTANTTPQANTGDPAVAIVTTIASAGARPRNPSKKPCRLGQACPYLQAGSCKFSHDLADVSPPPTVTERIFGMARPAYSTANIPCKLGDSCSRPGTC